VSESPSRRVRQPQASPGSDQDRCRSPGMLFRRPWQRKRNSLGLCKLQMASRPEAKTSKVDRINARHPAGPGKASFQPRARVCGATVSGQARRSASRWNLGRIPAACRAFTIRGGQFGGYLCFWPARCVVWVRLIAKAADGSSTYCILVRASQTPPGRSSNDVDGNHQGAPALTGRLRIERRLFWGHRGAHPWTPAGSS
jgi:hypothetical protein